MSENKCKNVCVFLLISVHYLKKRKITTGTSEYSFVLSLNSIINSNKGSPFADYTERL